MKKEILKIAGVKSEAEFYKKFPTEATFMKVHGEEFKKAKLSKRSMPKYEIGGIEDQLMPLSFDDWFKQQDFPGNPDRSMFKGMYMKYLDDFGVKEGFTKIGDDKWQKQFEVEDKNSALEYSDWFKGFNNILDMTQIIAGTVNDVRNRQDERERLLKERYPKTGYNVNQGGINNIPVYFKKGGELPKMQNAGNWRDRVKSFFTEGSEEEKKPMVLKMPYDYKIEDKRQKSLTTGKPINPNVDLLTDQYSSARMLDIARAAKRYDLDPYLAIAIDLQETGLGKRSDGRMGHSVLSYKELMPTKMGSEEEADDFDRFARAVASKLQYADKLGIKDEATRIQTYNGLGKIFPETEQDYHGFKMAKIYGVPVPKEGIDMRKNPLYGKRILDIRDNILKQDKNLDMYIRNVKKTGGPVSVKKAKEILKDGTIGGKPLTNKQRGYFGFIAGGGKPKMQYAGPVDVLNNAVILAQEINENGAYVPVMQIGGNNPYINNTGYLDGANTSNNPYNIIPSNNITMQGVSQDITAYPINKYGIGKPVNMQANNPNNYKFPSADYVLEVPTSGNSLNFMAKGGKMCSVCGGKMPCKCGGKVHMKDGGEIYEMQKGGSFGQAFAAARKDGKQIFTWKGKKYTTQLAEEVNQKEARSIIQNGSTKPVKKAAASAAKTSNNSLVSAAQQQPYIPPFLRTALASQLGMSLIPGYDARQDLESGTIVDKGTNTLHVIQNGRIVKSAPILTGQAGRNKKKDPNKNPHTVSYLDNNPQDRSTPTGTYMMNPAQIYGYPGFNLQPIPAYGNAAPVAANTAIHVTYGAKPKAGYVDDVKNPNKGKYIPAEFVRRNAAYSAPADQRYKSYGCTNAQGETIDCLQQTFPNADTAIYIDTRDKRDWQFMNTMQQRRKKNGGEMIKAEELEEMGVGGIPQRYKNMGFTKTGVKKKSNRSGKKWMVLAKKGDKYKVVHGGYVGMKDYTQHGSEKRRKNFWNRMGGRNSAQATDPFSPLYWHKRFGTWQEGGQVNEEQIMQDEIMAILQEFAEMNNMAIEQLLEQLDQLPEEQRQQAIDMIVEQVASEEPNENQEENDEENQEMKRGGYKMYQRGGSLLEAFEQATKSNAVPQDYRFVGEKDNRKYYGKTETDFIGQLKPAKRSDVLANGKRYEDFIIGLLGQGYSPQELVGKGYISGANADKFAKYYVEPRTTNNYLYTEQERQIPTPVQTFEGENIYSGNKAFGKAAFKFREASDADVQAGMAASSKDPIKEFYFRKYKPNSSEIDYTAPMYKIPAKEWYNLTAGTTNLRNPQLLENFKMDQFQNGGIQQMGGVPRYQANAELEKGEVYQDQEGMIKKVAESEPVHEDGGSPQPDVYKVLEDTADKRRDLDSRLLKIKPNEAEYIVGFKPKGSTTHSKLFEQASQFYDKKAKSLEKKIKQNYEYVKYSGGGKYAQNSLDENLKMLAQLPTKADLFDIIYNHQEEVKGRYGIGQEEQMRLGGLKKFQPGGLNYVESSMQNAPAWEQWAPFSTSKLPNWLNYWVKSNTPKGGISATTGKPTTYNPSMGNEIYDNYAYWRSLYGKDFESPQKYQEFVFNTIIKEDPAAYNSIMGEWGMPSAGTLSDGYFGARTAAATKWRKPSTVTTGVAAPPQKDPVETTNIKPGPEKVPVDEQFAKPGDTQASSFYEPLRWYDVAGTTAAYLSALEREPVALEQLSIQPLQARELNPLPVLQQNQAAFNAAMQQIPTSGVGAANIANLLGSKYAANAQVLGQYENINKQAKTQMDMYNQNQQLSVDRLNLGFRDQFAQRVLAGKEVQRQSKLNAFDDYLTKIAQNRKLNREGNLVLQMTPYFDQYGRFNGNVLGITRTAQSMGGNVTTQKTADGKTQYTVTDQSGRVIRTFTAK